MRKTIHLRSALIFKSTTAHLFGMKFSFSNLSLLLKRVKFTNQPSSPLVPHIKENTPAPLLHPSISRDKGWFVTLPLKRGGVAFQAMERHCYFKDREKLLKEKDLRIFVAITEKSYFFKILCFDFTERSFSGHSVFLVVPP